MARLWSIAALLDLEFFLGQDRLGSADDDRGLSRRDRSLYLDAIVPEQGAAGQTDNDRALVHRWLELRRAEYLAQPDLAAELPGRVYRELLLLLRLAALGSGLLLGIGVTAPLLAYGGTAPLNVTAYFVLLVLVQLLLLATQLLALAWRGLRRRKPAASFLVRWLSRAGWRLAARLERRARSRRRSAGEAARTSFFSGAGPAGAYGGLLLWSTFLLLQLVGIGFNGGILSTTLAKVLFSDIAFGWQSTLQVSETLVAELVRWIALPWSWLLPEELAYPSLEAIAGSRMVLKDGIYHLSTLDLVSWWPFLCCAVLSYGLLPRLGLLLFGFLRQRRLLSELPSMEDPGVRQLVRRLLTPLVESSGRKKEQPPPAGRAEEPAQELPGDTAEAGSVPAPLPVKSSWLLVPEELALDFPLEQFAAGLQSWLGEAPLSLHSYDDELEAEDRLPAALAREVKAGAVARVVVVQESWQPPIEEFLSFLETLRRAAGPGMVITIVLIGKPGADTILTQPEQTGARIWEMKVATLGDSEIEVCLLP
ncbi:DUF2868 domain-containing protein [Desulfogranum mediterraneum]|uniref:DUF2868 domain-containing protein n=1 Tax=Desulfogranum mediterraneum TaxID=160661 RepID=UPI0004210353|nr:DUF2868 domain-containing protein [Desulfogranum mediterraneum]